MCAQVVEDGSDLESDKYLIQVEEEVACTEGSQENNSKVVKVFPFGLFYTFFHSYPILFKKETIGIEI